MCSSCSLHKTQCIFSYFTSMELIFLNLNILKFSYQALVLHLISPMKVKSCWSGEHNTAKYRLEKCQFNIGSNGTHSVLDTPDLWANIVVYVTVEFPIGKDRQLTSINIASSHHMTHDEYVTKSTWSIKTFF